MACHHFTLNGATGIYCTSGRKRMSAPCSICGKPHRRLCDWKIRRLKSGKWKTCDALLCDGCSYSPAPEKDLCPAHRAMWESRVAKQADLLLHNGDNDETHSGNESHVHQPEHGESGGG